MKRFLSILLAMVMVLSLVACGDKKTPDTPDPPDTPDKQEETIHIGIVTGSVSQSEDDRRGAEAFQQLYGEENVTLGPIPITSPKSWRPPSSASSTCPTTPT